MFASRNWFLARFWAPAAAMLLLALSACGGGGGGTEPQITASTQTQTQTPVGTSETLIAAPGMGEITITWPSVDGAVSYNAYWGTAKGVSVANGEKITGVSSPFTHTELTDGVGYYYIVTAVMADGSESQPWSEAWTVSGSCHKTGND